MNNEESLREKLRQAIIGSYNAISLSLNSDKKIQKEKENFEFINIDKIDSHKDFKIARAESDTEALKKRFSDNLILNKNQPRNMKSKELYNISERLRYELIGSNKYTGIKKKFDF